MILRFRTFVFLLVVGLESKILFAENLFSLDGKAVDTEHLSPASKSALHDVDLQRYQALQRVIDDEILTQHFNAEAQKQKKTPADIEAELLKAPAPSDSEIKKFYEENKQRIPPNYTFDQVKPEIIRALGQQNAMQKRQKLLDQLKKTHKFELLAREPEAPVIELKVDEFHKVGQPQAKLRIVEFADYQCPHCRETFKGIEEAVKKYEKKLEFVFVDFPINPSGISRTVAEGAYCASKQNKFMDYHRAAFTDPNLTKDSPLAMAKKIKLDEAAFTVCLNSAEAKSFVERGKDEGMRVGVSGTPSIYFNGKRYNGAHRFEDFKKEIEKYLK